MPNHLRSVHWLLVGTISIVAYLGRAQLSAQEVARAPSGHSKAQQDSDSDQAAPQSTPSNGRALFAKHCVSCHGVDGTGARLRRRAPETPDFTDVNWQQKRSNAELLVSILEGKGLGMPPAPDGMDEKEAQSLLVYVRAFAPTAASDADKEFASLREQLKELQKEFRELSKPRPASTPSKLAESQKSTGVAALLVASEHEAQRQFFRQHCAKCHGIDGTGTRTRRRYPDIPDFTDAEWQTEQSDGQILRVILEGKGTEMPAWAEKISVAQARGLVSYIRALNLTRPSSNSR